MPRSAILVIALSIGVNATNALAQAQEPAKSKVTDPQTQFRKDDPCAEPEKKLKKKTIERPVEDKPKSGAQKP